MSRLQLYRFGWLVLLVQFSSLCRADTAYLQPASIYLGDVAELVIEFENSTPSLYPLDTTRLTDDFEILDKKSRVMRVLDAVAVTHRMRWRVQLAARRSGKIEVPKLYFGDKSTPPLMLEVLPLPAALQASHDVRFEMESASLTPYVGQQTQIEMRLYHNTPVSGNRLFEPDISKARIYRQVEEEFDSVVKNGQPYQVRSRGLALFPERPGVLNLTSAGFRGAIDSAIGVRNIFRRSNPLQLQVREPPSEFSGRFWLPASGLEISQRLDQTGASLKVGESLDWTLILVARGLPAEALPQDLLVLDSGKLRIYADQPIRSNRFEGRQIIGRLEQRFAVVANQPGLIDLPAVTLKWWDIGSDSERQAGLEARTIQVVAAATTPNGLSPSGWDLAMLKATFHLGWANWIGVLAGLLLLAAILALLRGSRERLVARRQAMLRRLRLRRNLRHSCRSNNAAGTRAALIEWGRERWPDQSINGLHQIGGRIASRELALQLEQLDAALYSDHATAWQGQALWRLIAALPWHHGSNPQIPQDELPRLYPA